MVIRTKQGWRFTLIRPGAQRVYLIGDFRAERITVQMARVGSDLFQVELTLSPGEYHFRYCADGRWITDYAAFGVEKRLDGDFDSVLYVPDTAQPPVGPSRLTPDRLARPMSIEQ